MCSFRGNIARWLLLLLYLYYLYYQYYTTTTTISVEEHTIFLLSGKCCALASIITLFVLFVLLLLNHDGNHFCIGTHEMFSSRGNIARWLLLLLRHDDNHLFMFLLQNERNQPCVGGHNGTMFFLHALFMKITILPLSEGMSTQIRKRVNKPNGLKIFCSAYVTVITMIIVLQ